MSTRISYVLVVSLYKRMLLTPLTPCETRLNARDQGPKHDEGVRGEVRKAFTDNQLDPLIVGENAIHRETKKKKAGQDAKHSKT